MREGVTRDWVEKHQDYLDDIDEFMEQPGEDYGRGGILDMEEAEEAGEVPKLREFTRLTKDKLMELTNDAIYNVFHNDNYPPKLLEVWRRWELADSLAEPVLGKAKATYDELPDEIPLYRGDKDYTLSNQTQNFTTDPAMAKKFAGEDGNVYKYLIKKDDLHPEFNNWYLGESEIVLEKPAEILKQVSKTPASKFSVKSPTPPTEAEVSANIPKPIGSKQILYRSGQPTKQIGEFYTSNPYYAKTYDLGNTKGLTKGVLSTEDLNIADVRSKNALWNQYLPEESRNFPSRYTPLAEDVPVRQRQVDTRIAQRMGEQGIDAAIYRNVPLTNWLPPMYGSKPDELTLFSEKAGQQMATEPFSLPKPKFGEFTPKDWGSWSMPIDFTNTRGDSLKIYPDTTMFETYTGKPESWHFEVLPKGANNTITEYVPATTKLNEAVDIITQKHNLGKFTIPKTNEITGLLEANIPKPLGGSPISKLTNDEMFKEINYTRPTGPKGVRLSIRDQQRLPERDVNEFLSLVKRYATINTKSDAEVDRLYNETRGILDYASRQFRNKTTSLMIDEFLPEELISEHRGALIKTNELLKDTANASTRTDKIIAIDKMMNAQHTGGNMLSWGYRWDPDEGRMFVNDTFDWLRNQGKHIATNIPKPLQSLVGK
jgi:hypothetical protein